MPNYLNNLNYVICSVFVILCMQSEPFVGGKDFKIYWNVDGRHCKALGVEFDFSRFGIIQNRENSYQDYDEKISIVYNPGRFPYYDMNNVAKYGGIPQKGNMTAHLIRFRNQLSDTNKTAANFNGAGVLDFETYFPRYDSVPSVYKGASIQWAWEQHPTWTQNQIEAYAKSSFNEISMLFFKSVLEEAKRLRPEGLWGYYHYPYCKNWIPKTSKVKECPLEMQEANTDMLSLYESSGAFYPSIYIKGTGTWVHSKACFIQVVEKINEAKRIRNLTASGPYRPILPYFWYRYHDLNEFLSVDKILATLGAAKTEGCDGAIIWDYVSTTKEDCIKLKEYVFNTLGPIVAYLVGKY